MIDEIINVTPDNESAAENVTSTATERKVEKEKNVRKNNNASRGVALGATVVGAGVAGAAVAQAMNASGEEEVIEDVVEVEADDNEPSIVQRIFGDDKKPDDKKPAEHKDEAQDVTPDAEDKGEGLREPDLDTHHEDKEKVEEVQEDEVNGQVDEVIGEVKENFDQPEDDVQEYIEQPDLGHIDVEIDEQLDMDAAVDIVEG